MSAKAVTYKTIEAPSEGLYKEKGSKFIAYAFPVKSEDEVKKILSELRKKYYDARHHCSAFRIGPGGALFRANDDQEPSGSAGKPILGQLLSFEVTDVLIVVVRYFGGTKLGVGGLITAYKTAAKEALSVAKIIECDVVVRYELRFSYEFLTETLRTIKEHRGKIIKQETDRDCLIELTVPLLEEAQVLNKWNRILNLQYKKTAG